MQPMVGKSVKVEMMVKKWGVYNTTKTLIRVSAKDRLLHMKKKDDQSTVLNSKQ